MRTTGKVKEKDIIEALKVERIAVAKELRNLMIEVIQSSVRYLDGYGFIDKYIQESNEELEKLGLEELKYIDKTWDEEGDLSRRTLVDLYYEIKGKHLPWDDYKVPVFSEEVIDEIKKQCKENNVEFELISKLIVEIEANKNYTKGSRVTKAFDRTINQGWLHFETIQKGLNHEDQ
jgi:DNA sulfur modification protein DndC